MSYANSGSRHNRFCGRGRKRSAGRGRTRWAAAVAIALLATGCGGVPAPVRLPDAEFRRGISLGLYASQPSYDYRSPLIDEIADHATNAISFVIVLRQENVESNEVTAENGRTVPSERLREAIRHAHGLGLETMLLPIVLLKDDADGEEWRGTIRPRDLDAWFASYREHLLGYAKLAEEEGAAWLSLGSELCGLEKHADRWRSLLADVRAAYSGKIVYAANWDHLDTLGIWPELDAMGMSGYFELSKSTEPTLDELEASWERWRASIENQRARLGIADLPLMFTEIGYPSQDGAARYPWDYTLGKPLDHAEQVLCFRAFFNAWRDDPRLLGIYVYNWFGVGGMEDGDYSPRGKPAAELIKREYELWGERRIEATDGADYRDWEKKKGRGESTDFADNADSDLRGAALDSLDSAVTTRQTGSTEKKP